MGYKETVENLKKNKFYADINDEYNYIQKLPPDELDVATNTLQKYKYTECKQGLHSNTYKLYVSFDHILDISHLPNKYFEKLKNAAVKCQILKKSTYRFNDVTQYVINIFLIISYIYIEIGVNIYKSDRFNKISSRLYLLQHYYYHTIRDTTQEGIKNYVARNKKKLNKIDLENIKNFYTENKKNIIMYGKTAIFYHLHKNSIISEDDLFEKINDDITHYEFVSTNFNETMIWLKNNGYEYEFIYNTSRNVQDLYVKIYNKENKENKEDKKKIMVIYKSEFGLISRKKPNVVYEISCIQYIYYKLGINYSQEKNMKQNNKFNYYSVLLDKFSTLFDEYKFMENLLQLYKINGHVFTSYQNQTAEIKKKIYDLEKYRNII